VKQFRVPRIRSQRIQHRVRLYVGDGHYGTILVSPFQRLECFVFLPKARVDLRHPNRGDNLSLREFVQSSEQLLRICSSTRYGITVSLACERLEIISGDTAFSKFGHRFLVHRFLDIGHTANVVGRNELWIQFEYLGSLLCRLVVPSCQEKCKSRRGMARLVC
jgi:hypothetical protein